MELSRKVPLAYPLDHPRAEVFFDTFQRAGRDDPKMLSLELEPVLPIIVPQTLTFDILACCDNSRTSHHGNEIALITNLDT